MRYFSGGKAKDTAFGLYRDGTELRGLYWLEFALFPPFTNFKQLKALYRSDRLQKDGRVCLRLPQFDRQRRLLRRPWWRTHNLDPLQNQWNCRAAPRARPQLHLRRRGIRWRLRLQRLQRCQLIEEHQVEALVD